MSAEVVARQSGQWRVVSVQPDVCKTPMGSAMVPVPYPIVAVLGDAAGTAKTVRANGHAVIVLDQSETPSCKGDAAGSGKGIKSGTTGGKCTPSGHSNTVRAQGKLVIRHHDTFDMNG